MQAIQRTKRGRQIFGMVEACCHRVTYRYWGFPKGMRLTPDCLKSMENQAEEHIKESINNDFSSGQLCAVVNETEIFGWWEIESCS